MPPTLRGDTSRSATRAPGLILTLGNQEVDGEADRSLRLDEVLDIDDDIGDWRRLGDEAQPALIDPQTAPCPARHSVRTTQRGRHGVLVPRRGRADDDEL